MGSLGVHLGVWRQSSILHEEGYCIVCHSFVVDDGISVFRSDFGGEFFSFFLDFVVLVLFGCVYISEKGLLRLWLHIILI